MRTSWVDKLLPNRKRKGSSWMRGVVSGSLYKVSDLRGNQSFSDIKTQIDTMRALARDSQINTALSYYATDSTTANNSGQIIWATPVDKHSKEVAEIVNTLFKKWNVVAYARDHILELATVGNLYIPTTDMYKEVKGTEKRANVNVALDFNTIPDENFEIIPSTKIDPKEIVHLWYQGQPEGFIYKPDDDGSGYVRYPETAVIHFSLGGLLGDYTLDASTSEGEKTYDIQFAQPLFEAAVQPTQTLSLLEDANILSSLIRIVKFINVDCSNAEEEEITDALQQIKDAIEQQLAINTASGDVQSFVNPQSPNNLIYLPKVNGNDAISITDLNMSEHNDTDSKLLEYYQNKKLSVLGVPKEMLNFSSNEGLGGAGNVMSQRSAIYANGLQRLMTAYMTGWTQAINTYFQSRNMSGFVDKFTLHMNPIITPLSTVQAEKRDAALSQASTLVQLLKDMGVRDTNPYLNAITEILTEAFPKMSAEAATWGIDLEEDAEGGGGDDF